MIRKIVFVLLAALYALPSFSQQTTEETTEVHTGKQWFKEAKLGIFIHWGIYAVNGIPESWAFFNETIAHDDYLKQAEGFTVKDYDPKAWARSIRGSGAQYAVITSKHHDGFALWDSEDMVFNAVRHSAAKRDLLTPLVKALREEGLKTGLYYSLPDWSFEDYTDLTRTQKRYVIDDDPRRWKKFKSYMMGQLKDLKEHYDPDLWWFDGDWEHSAEEWDIEGIKALLLKDRPDVLFNSRLKGQGHYETPEIGVPVYKPQADLWELCVTMNDSWGYQHNDRHYKTSQQIIDLFVDCLHHGGNMLLDIGPMANGVIPEEQENILSDLGRWTAKHKEAIYGSKAGIPFEHYMGPTTLSADKRTLYVFVRDIPRDGKIFLKGINNQIHRAYVVGRGTLLTHETFYKVYWNKYPGVTYIDVPEAVLDEQYTVIGLVLDGPINLFREETGAVESN